MLGILYIVWNGVAALQMVRCKNATEDMDFPKGIASTYSRIAYAGLGWTGVLFADSSVFITLMGVCIAYQITFATFMGDLPDSPLTMPQYFLLFAVIVFPISCAKDLGILASLSIFGLSCILINLFSILVYGSIVFGDQVGQESSSNPPLTVWPGCMTDLTTYIGIDVSKDSLSVAIPKPGTGWKMNNYVNSPDGIRSLLNQLPEHAHCVLEATGSYSVLVTYMLTQAKVTISVINPKQSHHFAKMHLSITKTDPSDAILLSEYGRVIQPPVYQISNDNLLLLKQKRTLLRFNYN